MFGTVEKFWARIKTSAATIVAVALLVAAAEAQTTTALMPGADYATVRQTLQAQGYQPLAFPRGGEDCIGSKDICNAYPEIISCSGMGFNRCRFAFRAPDGSFLVGVAAGEDVEQMRLTAIAAANAEDTQAIENLLAGRPELADGADAATSDETAAANDPIPQSAPETAPPTNGSDKTLAAAMFLGLILVGIGIYLLPTIIAFSRRHRYRWPIFGFNIGAGWSGIGWIWTLVWSVWPQNTAIIDPLISDATGSNPRQ